MAGLDQLLRCGQPEALAPVTRKLRGGDAATTIPSVRTSLSEIRDPHVGAPLSQTRRQQDAF